ncbi:MAG: tetratricopeptide repeat protein, partial [Dehalococcoidia bacterium]
GEFERAIEDLDEAIRLDPRVAMSYGNRGFAYYNLGEFERAIEDYDEAIRLDPQDAVAYVLRAMAYTLLNMDSAAQQDIDRAIELGFAPAFLEQLIEELKGLR